MEAITTGRKLPRVFFTAEMRDATLAGRKHATTRDHRISRGEKEACTGSWRYPASIKPFGVINILTNAESTWKHSLENFKAEGFDSLEQMLQFASIHASIAGYADLARVYYHEYELVRIY